MPHVSYSEVEDARNYLLDRIGTEPDAAVILGSGMSAVDEIVRDPVRIDYAAIPHFRLPTVTGHRGEVVFGMAGSAKVLFFKGRVHYYEGATADQVTLCARVIGRLGVKAMLLTNAAGAINPHAGQLMLITDHINLLGVNPLMGPNEDRWGLRFPDQTTVYDLELREKLKRAARDAAIELAEGVYVALTGPSYETPAEIRFLRTIGADAVGFSTAPEAIVARHMGVRVAGISMLTNAAAGVSKTPLNHEEVLETAARMTGKACTLLARFFDNW
jgi:purine-nucleoside phosphorylase